MRLHQKINASILSILIVVVSACTSCQQDNSGNQTTSAADTTAVVIPQFNKDSAYSYVAAQCAFGPRVPNTKAHDLCANYFVENLKRFGLEVQVQEFKARAFDGTTLNGKNIIASTQPENPNRILLCAHWDSRPFADNDPDPKNFYKAIDGANDGASGAGVLMEIARILGTNKTNLGIDIVLLDLEDFGAHKNAEERSEDSWGLGSQYWSQQPHKPGYTARFGILLDMVGAKNPIFTKEHYSVTYASGILDKVWMHAAKLGYGKYFPDMNEGAVTDDHVYINKNLGIPTIDIIHYDTQSGTGFYPYWHTIKDNMEQIDAETLNIVGVTLLSVIFNEK